MRNDRVSGGVLCVFAVAIAWQSLGYPFGTVEEPGPGYLPFFVALILAAFGALVVLRGGESPRLALAQFQDGGKALAILAGLAFGALAIERIGYTITITLLLIFYLGVIERRHPAAVAVVALGTAFGSFHLFNTVLKVPLPVGPFGL